MVSTLAFDRIDEAALVAAPVSRERLEALTSLRFFAAAMIVLLHYSTTFDPKVLESLGSPALHQGVSFFYVLSGFILAYVYPKLDDWRAVAKFLRARLARIYPTHLLGLLLSIALTHSLQFSAANFQFLFLNLFLLQDWLPVSNSYWSFNSPSWSISCELFFYLAFPILLFKFGQTWRTKLLLCCALSCLMVSIPCVFKFTGGNSAYAISPEWFGALSPLTRLLEFCLGMITAYFFGKRAHQSTSGEGRSTILEILLVTSSIATLYAPNFAPQLSQGSLASFQNWMSNSLGAPIYALLIYQFARPNGKISKFLNQNIFVLLGEISFALYLIHYPLINFLSQNQDDFRLLPTALISVGYSLLVLNLSFLIFEIFEKPWREILLGKFTGRIPQIDRKSVRYSFCFTSAMILSIFSYLQIAHAHFLPWDKSEIRAVSQAMPDDFKGTTFGGVLALNGVSFKHEGKYVVLQLVWQALHETRLTGFFGLQLLDRHGNLLKNGERLIAQDNAQVVAKAGTRWLDKIAIPEEQFDSCQSLMLYVTDQSKSPVYQSKNFVLQPDFRLKLSTSKVAPPIFHATSRKVLRLPFD